MFHAARRIWKQERMADMVLWIVREHYDVRGSRRCCFFSSGQQFSCQAQHGLERIESSDENLETGCPGKHQVL